MKYNDKIRMLSEQQLFKLKRLVKKKEKQEAPQIHEFVDLQEEIELERMSKTFDILQDSPQSSPIQLENTTPTRAVLVPRQVINKRK